tara:strand:- start:213 stop:998 length:786 start_codon:yes stop_codon:yes gene_type:complete
MTSTIGVKKIQYPNGTDILTLDSSGSLAIGGTVTLGDDQKIKLGASGDLEIFHDTTNGNSVIHDTGAGNLRIRANDFQVTNAAASANLMFANDATGEVKLYHNGSEKLATASTGVAITGGVAIGGTGSANTLDDYEEGSWTPSVAGNTTYNNQRGRYVKIGSQVNLWFYIQINQRNSPGVPYIVGGSPFTNSGQVAGSGLVHYFQSIQNSAVVLTCRIDTGGANINVSGATGSSTTIANVNHDWVGNGSEVYGFVTHYVGS